MAKVCGESNPSQPSSPLHHQTMCLLLKNRTSTSTKVKNRSNRKYIYGHQIELSIDKNTFQSNDNPSLANSIDYKLNKLEHVGRARFHVE